MNMPLLTGRIFRRLVDGAMLRLARRVLPRNPAVMAMLDVQAQVTVAGLDAFAAWAGGVAGAGEAVRATEHIADEHKRELRLALVSAFITPIAAEDIYFLSARLDSVLNGAKDTVREAELLAIAPDGACADMAEALAIGVRTVAGALVLLGGGPRRRVEATAQADEAHRAVRRLERTYREAMSALQVNADLREVTARREVYRRFPRIAKDVSEVAERIWYAAVKEA